MDIISPNCISACGQMQYHSYPYYISTHLYPASVLRKYIYSFNYTFIHSYKSKNKLIIHILWQVCTNMYMISLFLDVFYFFDFSYRNGPLKTGPANVYKRDKVKNKRKIERNWRCWSRETLENWNFCRYWSLNWTVDLVKKIELSRWQLTLPIYFEGNSSSPL